MGRHGWDWLADRTTAVVAAAALLLSGCTAVPAPTTTAGGPAESATSPGTPSATLFGAGGARSPAAAGGNDISPHAAGSSLPFECANPIGAASTSQELAGPGAIGVPGVMAISISVIGSNTIHWGGGASYQGLQFAKVGLVLKAGTAFTLSVPAEMHGTMLIGWSNSGYTLAHSLTIPGCTSSQPDADWLAYPGGFWLKAPGCVPLTVTQERSSRTIHVPVGMPCPA